LGTHHAGRPEEIRALDTYIKLARATDTLYHKFARSLKERGLSTSQLGVLELLYHMGPMCQRAAAEKLLQSGGMGECSGGSIEVEVKWRHVAPGRVTPDEIFVGR
jgi:hypothetical protein